MTQELLLCPQCERGHLKASTFEDDFLHGGNSLHIGGLECYVCDRCGADPVFADQIRRNELRIADAKRRADGMLTGEEIRCVRDRLGLSQQDAAVLFGGGTNAFSKYERGNVMQSVAMDRLLKVAAFYPFVLEFLQREAGIVLSPQRRVDVARYQAGVSVDMGDSAFRSRSIAGHLKSVSSASWQKVA